MDDALSIIFSILLGIIVTYLVWLSFEPKYLVIKNSNNK